MKRLLVCLLLVGVVGCGESEQEAQQPNENIQQESTPAAKIPDAATVKKYMTPAQ